MRGDWPETFDALREAEAAYRKAWLKEMARRHRSGVEMAQALQMERACLYRMAREYGVTLPRKYATKGPRWPSAPDRVSALIACRDRGMTKLEAARELGISPSSVSHAVKRLDLEWPVDGRGKFPRTRKTPPQAASRPATPDQGPIARMRELAKRENAAMRRRTRV